MQPINNLYQNYLNSTGVSTDTRKVEEGNIFFALKGPNFNGNQYAIAALEKGAKYAVIDERAYHTQPNMILVDDVLSSLQQLATFHRKELGIPVIGIGGSNGKTTSKELIHSVLAQKFKVFATKGNLNNHIGVPLSILSIDKSYEIAVLELGANHVEELAFLCTIAQPDFGLITNNGLDHLEGYGSFEGVVQGNSELYYWLLKNNGIPFVNSKDEILMRMAARFNKTIKYGNHGDYFNAEIIGNEFFISCKTHQGITINTQLIGEYNIDNINAALCVGQYFGVDANKAANAIRDYVPSNNRSQLVKKNSNTIVLDCYNANPSSMKSSIESFSKLKTQQKILMLGDMFELGEHSIKEHKNLCEWLQTLDFNKIFYCGAEFENVKIGTYRNAQFFSNRMGLELYLKENPIKNSSILIKGSRGMAMEKLIEFID
jgi:UDP-N-acetylmuramoyl-tripeptide--D-alanyl-D-alanine ligase